MALLALVVLALLYGSARSEPTQDRAALLAFMAAVRHEPRLQWGANASACDWAGVTCDDGRTAVLAFRLPGVALVGSVPSGTLGRISSLRFLSLRSNKLSGPIPTDLAGLVHLRGLYLQNNLFAGGIPVEFAGLTSLVRLDLSGNNLTGPVPFALNNLTHLTGLFLQNNHLSGSLPSIGSLKAFNVSNNELNGSIPRSLEGFPASAFAGNLDLCGGPLPSCKPFFPSPAAAPTIVEVPTKETSKKLSTGAIIAIAVASATVFLLLMMLLVLVICLVLRRRRKGMGGKKEKSMKGVESAATIATVARSGETGLTSSSKDEMSGSGSALVEAERNKLVFVGANGGYSFDLEDLLRASAEVLGKGSTGTSYKAVLEEGNTVVVKRLKDVAVAKPDFESHLHTLGKVEHPNLLSPRAFYYSKDEKLLVIDYLPAGSLSSLLHGNRGSGRTPLGWESRLRVAISAGRGLAHLHTTARLVHGNVKASNVLLRVDDADSAALSDFALHPLFNSTAPRHRLAGYRAPEVAETRRPSFKSDVYSFGVLLLELLTGKAPNQASLGEEGIDLPRWVQSVVREEWTAEVFDVDLLRYPDTEEEEMVQLLQVAMACVATVPDARPDIAEVVRMMEQIANRAEGDDGPKSSPAGPANDGERSATPAAAAS